MDQKESPQETTQKENYNIITIKISLKIYTKNVFSSTICNLCNQK